MVTKSTGAVAPDPRVGGGRVNILRLPEQLPILLAGPIVRRVDSECAVIWAVTSVPVIMQCTVINMTDRKNVTERERMTDRKNVTERERMTDREKMIDREIVGFGETNSVPLGEKLFLTLISVAGSNEQSVSGHGLARSSPMPQPFPRGQLLGYNCEIYLDKALGFEGFEGDVLLNPSEIAYPGLDLPTFFLPTAGKPFNNVHASCRKLHGPGTDAIQFLDSHLRNTAKNVDTRPSVLMWLIRVSGGWQDRDSGRHSGIG